MFIHINLDLSAKLVCFGFFLCTGMDWGTPINQLMYHIEQRAKQILTGHTCIGCLFGRLVIHTSEQMAKFGSMVAQRNDRTGVRRNQPVGRKSFYLNSGGFQTMQRRRRKFYGFIVDGIAVINNQIAAVYRIGRSIDFKNTVVAQDIKELHHFMVGMGAAGMLLVLFITVVCKQQYGFSEEVRGFWFCRRKGIVHKIHSIVFFADSIVSWKRKKVNHLKIIIV